MVLPKIKKEKVVLEQLSKENKFLLSEANHRINNNLQLIIILINDQLKKQTKHNQDEIKNILSKVDSIATLHRHLYQNQDKTTINSEQYLKEILINFNDIFKENNINVNFNISEFPMPTDMAMYFGLLLTELCINSIKHAFTNQDYKEINFKLTNSNQLMEFMYRDNGKSNNVDLKPKLIDKLCRQLHLDYKIDTEKGFKFSFKKII